MDATTAAENLHNADAFELGLLQLSVFEPDTGNDNDGVPAWLALEFQPPNIEYGRGALNCLQVTQLLQQYAGSEVSVLCRAKWGA